MHKVLYFQLMKETSDVSDEVILDTIRSRCQGELCDLVSELPKKRANSNLPKMRPALFRFTYESVGGENWQQYKNTAAALEMLNLSTYTLNYMLDDKGGSRSRLRQNNDCIASMIQREFAQDLLRDSIPEAKFKLVDAHFSEINRYTSGIGQFLDGNALRDINDSYLETYLSRCEGLTGRFMKNVAEIGGILGGASPEEIASLGEFGRDYGIIIQIVNDVGDYLPSKTGKQSVGKVYQDQYSDLRHGCLTFPTYYILQYGTKEEHEAVLRVQGNLHANEKECLEVTRAFVKLGGIAATRELASVYARRAKCSLHALPKSEARDFLSTSLSVYRTNKFYDALKHLQDGD